MQRACVGDAASFGELVSRQSTSALRVATVVLGTTDGAADVVQDATVRAWQARNRIDPERGFRGWYLKIVANTARNDRRSRSRRASLAVRAAAVVSLSAVTPETEAVTASEREMVVRALNRLSPEDRLIVALRFFEDMTQAEIAHVIGCPTGTVKSRLSRALTKLRRALSDEPKGST